MNPNINTMTKNASQLSAFNAVLTTGLLCICAILTPKVAAATDFVVASPASVTYVENNVAVHSSVSNVVTTIVLGKTRAAPDAKNNDLVKFATNDTRSSVLDAANLYKHIQPLVKVSYPLPSRRIDR
ncbi:MAG: hypothetical protein LH481_16115 [Burkholderiales bacterium]|nr:hypothetical protein [Burkholderiales bacterium]